MFDRFRILSVVFGLMPRTRLQAEVLASIARLPKTPMHSRSKHYPHSSTRQRERGARQIASGFCKIANGLVRPGQVVLSPDADGNLRKRTILRPYC